MHEIKITIKHEILEVLEPTDINIEGFGLLNEDAQMVIIKKLDRLRGENYDKI